MKQDIQHIKRRWMKLRLQPIRVICFHQVSETFDPESMWKCDWMSTNDFKNKIIKLQKEYTFISLQDAYDKLNHNTFRFRKYAVLTADDGWFTIMNIIPWLAEQQIPITLFINPLYLDGVHKQERESEQLLTNEDLQEILQKYSNVTIASHGWTHVDTLKINSEEFEDSMQKSEEVLSSFPRKVPFYAFTYGHYKIEYLQVLKQKQLIPLLMDGQQNYRYNGTIHRENIILV